jgi:hypothetical protein
MLDPIAQANLAAFFLFHFVFIDGDVWTGQFLYYAWQNPKGLVGKGGWLLFCVAGVSFSTSGV